MNVKVKMEKKKKKKKEASYEKTVCLSPSVKSGFVYKHHAAPVSAIITVAAAHLTPRGRREKYKAIAAGEAPKGVAEDDEDVERPREAMQTDPPA